MLHVLPVLVIIAVMQIAPGNTSAKEDIANQMMIPQGIDLSSLGSLAAVLGVSQGLNLLVDKQQGM